MMPENRTLYIGATGTPGERAADQLRNVEAEASLIGCLLRDNTLADQITGLVAEEDFTEPGYGRLFATLMGEIASGRGATPVTVMPLFAADPSFEGLGGRKFLFEIAGSVAAAAPIRIYASVLRDLAMRRRVIASFTTAAAMAADISAPVTRALDFNDAAIGEALARSTSRPALMFRQAFDDVLEHIEKVRSGDVPPSLLVHGLSDWNEATGGISPGEYVLLGGRPSMGKTSLALSIMWRAALAGYGVLFISREMSTRALMLRVVADLLFEAGAKASFGDVKKARLTDEEMRLLERLHAETSSWPIVVENPENLTSSRIAPMIRLHAKRMEAKGMKLGLVVIDYLGLLDPPPGRPNREQEVTAVSHDIKDAAGATGVPIIALSQLSRAVEQREDKVPQLPDLRDSGSLEQDADIIVFVYRKQYYLERDPPSETNTKAREAWEIELRASRNKVDILCKKNRQGTAPVTRTSWFFGDHQAIRNSDYYTTGGGL